jgi:sulfotransferase family protein
MSILRAPMRIFQNRPDKENERTDGLTPISETDPADIFVVGYPKSGNTWMQNLIAGVAYNLNPEYLTDSQILDLVPDVHSCCHYRRHQTPMYFKTHRLPRPEYRRVIYLLRDGRDVMVSYYHHLRALNGDDVDFSEIVRTGRHLLPSKWHDHVNAWRSNPFGAEILTVRYEDLLENPVSELRRVCEFAGIERPPDVLENVSRKSSFSKMREKEEKAGWANPKWPRSRFFVRRGQAGSFKDEMPEDVLSVFMAQAGDTLRACNYL